jgi:hypothetical protein
LRSGLFPWVAWRRLDVQVSTFPCAIFPPALLTFLCLTFPIEFGVTNFLIMVSEFNSTTDRQIRPPVRAFLVHTFSVERLQIHRENSREADLLAPHHESDIPVRVCGIEWSWGVREGGPSLISRAARSKSRRSSVSDNLHFGSGPD